MSRPLDQTQQKYLLSLSLLAQLDQPVRLVRLDLLVPLVVQDLRDQLDPVDPLVPMVVTGATVLQAQLVVKVPQDLLARLGHLDLPVLLDHKVPLAVLHLSTTLAQQQQTATPVQVR